MKLLLADDHTLFRDALVQYIERSDINVSVTVAKSFDEASAILDQDAKYDLVVLDLRMPGMNGLEGFDTLRKNYPNIRTALMSGVADEADVRAAFDRGAVGYFPKTMSGKALLQGIRMVLSGEHFVPMDPKTNNMMPSYYDDGLYNARASAGTVYSKSDAHKNSEIFSLTPRETEVLSYLMKGVSNKEIANELGLQVVTVKLHVRGVCRKLDVKNRTQAALKAQEYGLEIPDIRKHTA